MKNSFSRATAVMEASKKSGIRLVGFYDKLYPSRLRQISDPALVLSIKGEVTKLNELVAVAIVGTREPSNFGYRAGVRLGSFFGEAGCNVISGLANGCDTAAHIGCLAVGGVTTAVMSHGLDMVYPKENKVLAEEILHQGGLLISEYFIGQRPQNSFFVERDRIQAALAKAVVVVETDIKGGTMHTVKFATDYNRPVIAINHPAQHLTHPKTQGNQYLIKSGTALPLTDTASLEQLRQYVIGNLVTENAVPQQNSSQPNDSQDGHSGAQLSIL